MVELIYLIQKSNNWLALVKRAMHLWVPQNTGTSFPDEPLMISQERICSTEWLKTSLNWRNHFKFCPA